MSNAEHEPEYFSHVTLMFLGDDLDHRSVSRSLRLRPTQAWRKGESKPHGGSSFDWGVWKKAIPNAQLSQPLNRQLAFWVKALRGRAQTIKKLNNAGNLCALSCFIISSGTASIIIPPDLQRAIAALGLELRLSFFAHNNGD